MFGLLLQPPAELQLDGERNNSKVNIFSGMMPVRLSYVVN